MAQKKKSADHAKSGGRAKKTEREGHSRQHIAHTPISETATVPVPAVPDPAPENKRRKKILFWLAAILTLIALALLINPACRTVYSLVDDRPGSINKGQPFFVGGRTTTLRDYVRKLIGVGGFVIDNRIARIEKELEELLAKNPGSPEARAKMVELALASTDLSAAEKEELKKNILNKFVRLNLEKQEVLGLESDSEAELFKERIKTAGYIRARYDKQSRFDAPEPASEKPDYARLTNDVAAHKANLKKILAPKPPPAPVAEEKKEEDTAKEDGKTTAKKDEKKAAKKNNDIEETASETEEAPAPEKPQVERGLTRQFYLRTRGRLGKINSLGKDYSLRISPMPGNKDVFFSSNLKRPLPPGQEDGVSVKASKLNFQPLDIYRASWDVNQGVIIPDPGNRVNGLSEREKFGFDLYYNNGLYLLYTGFPQGQMRVFQAISKDGQNFREAGPVGELNALGVNTGNVSCDNQGKIVVLEADFNIWIGRRKGNKWVDLTKLQLSGDGPPGRRIMPDVLIQDGDIYVVYRNIMSGLYAAKVNQEFEVVGLSRIQSASDATKYFTVNQDVAGSDYMAFGSRLVEKLTGVADSFDIYQLDFGAEKDQVASLPPE